MPSETVRVVVVGDSVGGAMARVLEGSTHTGLEFHDGSVEGCGVFDDGVVRSVDGSYRRDLAQCAGWPERWARAARSAQAEVALVVLGAWDVFDLHRRDGVLRFASPEFDAEVRAHLQAGIDALVALGIPVVVMEVPCMRPFDVEGFDIPPLPERADDARVAHLSDLLRRAADANAATTRFAFGAPQWCGDEAIAADPAMRWDGVHPDLHGAALMVDAVAPALHAVARAGLVTPG